MLLVFGFFLFLTVASLLLLLPALWGREIRNQYAGSRAVICPETRRQVAVSLDSTHAAVTGLTGRPDLRIADCTRWPDAFKLRPGLHTGSRPTGTIHSW